MYDFSPLVGLPWKDRGRGKDGFDCWGLVVAAFWLGKGIILPSHAAEYSTAADRAETDRVFAGELADWAEVAGAERPFDVATFRITGRLHVGLVVRPGHMLHMPLGKSSVIERLARYAPVATGIYRYRELA